MHTFMQHTFYISLYSFSCLKLKFISSAAGMDSSKLSLLIEISTNAFTDKYLFLKKLNDLGC